MRKTLATINNETKGWLIVPFEAPQSVKKKKKTTSKLKTTSPVSTTSIESLKRGRKNVNGCKQACKNVQRNSCGQGSVVPVPTRASRLPGEQLPAARTHSAPWPLAPHRGRSWSTSRCSASSASSPARVARWQWRARILPAPSRPPRRSPPSAGNRTTRRSCAG